jgi:hypothetical protein
VHRKKLRELNGEAVLVYEDQGHDGGRDNKRAAAAYEIDQRNEERLLVA